MDYTLFTWSRSSPDCGSNKNTGDFGGRLPYILIRIKFVVLGFSPKNSICFIIIRPCDLFRRLSCSVCVFRAKWGNLFSFNIAGVFLGSNCQGANCFLITSHTESPDDGGQSTVLHHCWPSVQHEPLLQHSHATICNINTALFSLQSKTCHFICPSLAPNHSDGQERLRLCDGRQRGINSKTTNNALHSGIPWSGVATELVYVQHTQI